MPMCKKCKEVFGVIDMQDGFCKSCFTPERVVEEKQSLEIEKKNKRPILITLVSFPRILIYGIVLSLFIFGLLSGRVNIVETVVVIGLLIAPMIAFIALYNMKKWGAYMVILLESFFIISGIVRIDDSYQNLMQKGLTSHYAHLIPMVVILLQVTTIFVVIYYLKKMK